MRLEDRKGPDQSVSESTNVIRLNQEGVKTQSHMCLLPKPCSVYWVRSEKKKKSFEDDDGWANCLGISVKLHLEQRENMVLLNTVHCQDQKKFLLKILESNFDLLVLTMKNEAQGCRAGGNWQIRWATWIQQSIVADVASTVCST